MYSRLEWKDTLSMAPEDVKSGSGDEIAVGAQGNVLFALSLVSDETVQRSLRLCRLDNLHLDLKPYGEGESNDIETWTNVRRGTGYF